MVKIAIERVSFLTLDERVVKSNKFLIFHEYHGFLCFYVWSWKQWPNCPAKYRQLGVKGRSCELLGKVYFSSSFPCEASEAVSIWGQETVLWQAHRPRQTRAHAEIKCWSKKYSHCTIKDYLSLYLNSLGAHAEIKCWSKKYSHMYKSRLVISIFE